MSRLPLLLLRLRRRLFAQPLFTILSASLKLTEIRLSHPRASNFRAYCGCSGRRPPRTGYSPSLATATKIKDNETTSCLGWGSGDTQSQRKQSRTADSRNTIDRKRKGACRHTAICSILCARAALQLCSSYSSTALLLYGSVHDLIVSATLCLETLPPWLSVLDSTQREIEEKRERLYFADPTTHLGHALYLLAALVLRSSCSSLVLVAHRRRRPVP